MTDVDRRYDYSPAEITLLRMIPVKSRISSGDLTEQYYAGRKDRPFYARVFINSSMRTLMEKAEANNETFRIYRSETKPYEYWRTGRIP